MGRKQRHQTVNLPATNGFKMSFNKVSLSNPYHSGLWKIYASHSFVVRQETASGPPVVVRRLIGDISSSCFISYLGEPTAFSAVMRQTSRPSSSQAPGQKSEFGILLPWLSALVIGLLSGSTLASETRFEFRMHGVLLGEVTFHQTQSGADFRNSNDQLWISGNTRGPAYWFKHYRATFHSTIASGDKVHYRVDAVDGGETEIRDIEYYPKTNQAPQVRAFLDRTQATPLTPVAHLDSGRIDPLATLKKIHTRINVAQSCDGNYRVYDGKRRYTVRSHQLVAPLDTFAAPEHEADAESSPNPLRLACQITLELPTPESEPGLQTEAPNDIAAARATGVGFWPFKKQQQSMTIYFIKQPGDALFHFHAFNIASPFGTIKGRQAPQLPASS